MKARTERSVLPVLWMLIMAVSILLTACADHSDNQNVVFEDMEAAFEQADLLSSNIGLFSKTVSGDSISYGECGSGVIFDRQGDVYYALTAAHVVSGENAQLQMQVGSSGGAAINEQMQLVGITPGGYFSADGSSFKCGVLIPPSGIHLCLAEWSR